MEITSTCPPWSPPHTELSYYSSQDLHNVDSTVTREVLCADLHRPLVPRFLCTLVLFMMNTSTNHTYHGVLTRPVLFRNFGIHCQNRPPCPNLNRIYLQSTLMPSSSSCPRISYYTFNCSFVPTPRNSPSSLSISPSFPFGCKGFWVTTISGCEIYIPTIKRFDSLIYLTGMTKEFSK